VPELYAYNHHFSWWRSVKEEESQWEAAHDLAAPPPVAGIGAGNTAESNETPRA
jgi:hypothetical protein